MAIAILIASIPNGQKKTIIRQTEIDLIIRATFGMERKGLRG